MEGKDGSTLKHPRYDSLATDLMVEIDAKEDAFVNGAERLENRSDVFYRDVSVETADPDAPGNKSRGHY
jgi:hypothetical protein